tara:strand:+ start:1180 stop:1944 length:765 start_codon:yes stop_codon:yes gene_type:complete
MRIIIITQNEPFYLAKNLRYLFNLMPNHSKVIGCIVSDVSPFGKKEGFLKKAIKTYKIFGFKFFIYYSFKYIFSILNPSNNVLRLLKKENIKNIKLSKSINHTESLEIIKSYKPDLLISILGNQIFKSDLINLAPKGCINLHTALLPKFRGLMPTFWVLLKNQKKTGVSVFYVDKGIDSGPIIVQEEFNIEDRSQKQLIIDTKKLGMEAIVKAVDLIYNDNVKLITNDAEKMSYFSFPTKEDVREFKKLGKRFF